MVMAGQISIGGDIDTKGIETGLGRIEKGFEDVSTTGKSVNADFVRMNQSASRLGRTLGVLALTGAGALIALAKSAPVVAGAMAKIDLAMMKLKFAIGQALKPQIDWFALKLSQFAGWVQEHPDLFGKITTSILVLAGAFAAFKIGGAFVALIGFLASPPVLIAIAALTALAAAILSVNMYMKEMKRIGIEGTVIEKIIFALTKGPLAFGPAAKGIDDYIMDWVKSFFRKISRKSQSFAQEDII